MEAWPEDELSRRERLRAQREAAHAAPARIGMKLTAVVVIVVALLAWLVVSWFTSARSASAPVPEPPTLVTGTPESGLTPGSAASDNAAEGAPEPAPGPGRGAAPGDAPGTEESNAAGPNASGPNDAGPDAEGVGESVVHVSGAVKEPGVVELPPGSRVHEAIEAAGGMTKEADPGGLNLAAPVQDGTLIWVPTPEELEGGTGPPGQNPAPGTGQASGQAGSSVEGPAELINLNTADAQTLDELPGIGPALSERIIAHREANGPFGSLEELAAVSGIGPVILADVEGLVTW